MSKAKGVSDAGVLTDRQFAVLKLYWDRKNAKEIAKELGISYHGVEKHLLACRERLGVSTSAQAARLTFGEEKAPTVKPYYEPSEVSEGRFALQFSATSTAHDKHWGVAGEQAPINRFGALATLAIILAVALASVCILALLVGMAQGIIQLGQAMGY